MEFEVYYSIASFLVQLFYANKKSHMALMCAPKSPYVLPLSWKRTVTDTSANGTLKRIKDATNRPKVYPLCDDEHSAYVKSIEEKNKSKENESGNATALSDFSITKPSGLKMNKKRPTKLVIPGNFAGQAGFGENRMVDSFGKVSEVEEDAFCLFAKKGGGHAMEDGYGAVNASIGDSKLVIYLINFKILILWNL
jgi:hypothetical protein